MKIFCIGRNYVDHAKELGNEVPSEPLVFMNPPTALLINNKPFYYPDFSKDIHYECEIVVKIGKNGKNIQPQFAKNYIKEISLGIDYTARDLQTKLKEKGHPWEIAKGFNGSAVIGDFIPLEQFEDVNNIHFHLIKNGEKVQIGNTKDMLFNIEKIITHISKYFLIHQGDYIYTGTPAGVGPIQIGDLLEGYIQEDKIFQCRIK
jgi:2-keto-4-pentenoate hydratase/2-oxohepta-3-ene-1,7-dioic acid hydratase in catechol pathway